MSSIELEMDFITLNVDYDFKPATEQVFDTSDKQWFPGDPPSVKLKSVYIENSGEKIEVMPALSGDEKFKIEQEILEFEENEVLQ